MFISNYAPQPFKAYCAMWVRCSKFLHQASPRVSPAAEGVGEKCPVILPKFPTFTLHLGIFYMP